MGWPRSCRRRPATGLWRAVAEVAVTAGFAVPAALAIVPPAAASQVRVATPTASGEACSTADLLLRAGPSGVGDGRRYAVYDLVDGSAASCTVRGYPGTGLLRPDGRPSAHLRELHSTRRGADSPAVPLRTVRLAPGGQSDFWMEWTPRAGRRRGSLTVAPPQRRAPIVVRNRLVPLDAGRLTVSPLTSSVLER